MFKVLVIDCSAEDAEWLRCLLEEEGAEVVVCRNGTAARPVIEARAGGFTMVFMLWNGADPAFAETLALLRHRRPETMVIVMIEEFTAELGPKALALKADGYLQKPLESEKVRASCREFLKERGEFPLMEKLRQTIFGESPQLKDALRRLARAIPHTSMNVLLLGESGTGKELFARAIHDFGPRPDAPFMAVQVSALSKGLFESEMFGHEKGAFTGADKQRIGYLEQAAKGTIFLDEIGDLEISGQVALLRAIQEKRFRRLNGAEELLCEARLVCATHHDLREEAKLNNFRNDLFQRINELTIYVPPLRERKGDIEILARLFLNKYKGERQAAFADETLKILCGYHFPGNVRELENIVKKALINCNGEIILPQNLPMADMIASLPDPGVTESNQATDAPGRDHIEALIDELTRSLPAHWMTLAYREARSLCIQAFNRVYLPNIYERHGYNLSAAAKAAGLDPKTFRNYWKEAGLPPLKGEEEG